MSYWSSNSNFHGYYYDPWLYHQQRIHYCYYGNNYIPQYYSNQQPIRGPSRPRRNRRSKKNLHNINFLKYRNLQHVNMRYANCTELAINSIGVLQPLMLENKSGLVCNQNSIKSQVQTIGKVEQNYLNTTVVTHVPQTTYKMVEVNENVAPASIKTRSQNVNQLENLTTLNKLEVVRTVPEVQQTNYTKVSENKFSVEDPNTPEFMQSIREAFHTEIDSMQTRLKVEASLRTVHGDKDLMVAQIYIESSPKISDEFFEFMRTEVVGWVGAYQQQGMNTPIFHSIAKKDSYLTIVCDNKYAYECVERCVVDLSQMNTIGPLKILAVPSITPIIYCFDAIYEGIASDPALFLSQLQLHKTKLYSNGWLVASHKVCSKERRTDFIFLVDERSALALNFCYKRSFYVCMQLVTFRNRGIVAKI